MNKSWKDKYLMTWGSNQSFDEQLAEDPHAIRDLIRFCKEVFGTENGPIAINTARELIKDHEIICADLITKKLDRGVGVTNYYLTRHEAGTHPITQVMVVDGLHRGAPPVGIDMDGMHVSITRMLRRNMAEDTDL